MSGGIGSDQKGPAGKTIAIIENNGNATAAGLTGAPAGATWEVVDDRGPSIRLTLPPHGAKETLKLVIWSGPLGGSGRFCRRAEGDYDRRRGTLCKGGPARWPQELTTQGELGDADPKNAKVRVCRG